MLVGVLSTPRRTFHASSAGLGTKIAKPLGEQRRSISSASVIQLLPGVLAVENTTIKQTRAKTWKDRSPDHLVLRLPNSSNVPRMGTGAWNKQNEY